MEHAKVLNTRTCRTSSCCHVMTHQTVSPYRHSPRHIFNHLLSLVGDQKREREVAMKLQPRRGSARGWRSGRVIAACHYPGVMDRLPEPRAAVSSFHQLSATLANSERSDSEARCFVRCESGIHDGHRADFTQAPDK